MLEAAIPVHQRVERTLPPQTPPNYEPPFPAYIARYPKTAKDLVMAVIGSQHKPGQNAANSIEKLREFIASKNVPPKSRPKFREVAEVTDNRGYHNMAFFAYWLSKVDYDAWFETSGFQAWWQNLNAGEQEQGWFLEVLLPTMDRIETVFSNNEVREGAAHMREGISQPIQEHVYWGSMRDRLPISQTDELTGDTAGSTKTVGESTSRRIRVPGKPNLAVIRSGQDWSDTLPEERKLYLDTMHPTLITGMDFLRDHGNEVGCYSCRFMGVEDQGSGTFGKDRTFGLAYFNELRSLESWSKEHKTHLDIFGGFLKYAQKLQNNISLRLFHEVLVLTPEQQLFEYINCHTGTGMLASI